MITPFEEANPALLSCPARSTAVLSKATPHLATPSPSPPHPLPSTSTAQHPQLATAAAPPVIHREPELSSFVHEKGVATSNRIQGVRSTLPSPDATPDSGAHGQGAGTSAGERGTCCQNNYATEGGVASQSQSSQSQLESQEGSEGCAGMKGGMEMDCDEVEESQNYTPAAAEAGRSNASSSSKDRFVNGLVGQSFSFVVLLAISDAQRFRRFGPRDRLNLGSANAYALYAHLARSFRSPAPLVRQRGPPPIKDFLLYAPSRSVLPSSIEEGYSSARREDSGRAGGVERGREEDRAIRRRRRGGLPDSSIFPHRAFLSSLPYIHSSPTSIHPRIPHDPPSGSPQITLESPPLRSEDLPRLVDQREQVSPG